MSQGRLNNSRATDSMAPVVWRSEYVSSPDRCTPLSEEIYAFVGESDSITCLVTLRRLQNISYLSMYSQVHPSTSSSLQKGRIVTCIPGFASSRSLALGNLRLCQQPFTKTWQSIVPPVLVCWSTMNVSCLGIFWLL